MKANLQQRYVDQDGRFTIEGVQLLDAMARRILALENKMQAIAAVTAPTGGATTDAEARAAISAIIDAA